ncbi:hypothetical protein CONPUDRAFT_40790, partial [Coniophora puteana RWD-64-598 SS2]
KLALEFIKCIREARLDDPVAKLSEEVLYRLRHPPHTPPEPLSPLQKHSITNYFALENASIRAFEEVRASEIKTFNVAEQDLLHFDAVEKLIAKITGVESVQHDMCWDSCQAFTGPLEDDLRCSQCGKHRYDQHILKHKGKLVSRKFHTILLGPLLQAIYRDPQSAEDLAYRVLKTHEVLEAAIANNRIVEVYDDYISGSDYIQSLLEKKIRDEDILIMSSLDGAQLFESQASDCWIYIWVILEYSPDKRYKKQYVYPGGFIPGPNKPKNVDSFLFPGYHHVSALQREGLEIYNAWEQRQYTSFVHHYLATADGPGLVYFNGMCGHCGQNGCRLYCGVRGRRKTHGKTYYPALAKPDSPTYKVKGSDHATVLVQDLPPAASTEYYRNLKMVVSARSETAYDKARRYTGITKPSILIGLQPEHTLEVPRCLAPDQMHLAALLATLHIDLWRGEIDNGLFDDPRLWPFSIFLDDDVWTAHGLDVEALGLHIPGLLDAKPRNVKENHTSGYKTWEFIIWFYGECPGLLYELLPLEYWKHFCKLVRGFRLISQHLITLDELREAQNCFLSWYEDYERLYYGHREDRLHFVRQSVHQVTHLVEETIKKGPPICYAQWTMERTIGNLGQEIRQPSQMYENFSRQGVRRCMKNALRGMMKEFDPPTKVSSLANDLGNGYLLLRARDRYKMYPKGREFGALARYMGCQPHKIRRWARLQLPNGHITRCAWRENASRHANIRIARNVRFEVNGHARLGEVIYYTQVRLPSTHVDAPNEVRTVALIWPYSNPDPNLLEWSSQTLWSCRHLGEASTTVIEVTQIKALVGMLPHSPTIPSTGVAEARFHMLEKPGFDVATYAGPDESDPEQEDD